MTSRRKVSAHALRDDLARGADEVHETHISWVFLVGDEVFKVKKPVGLGFLDFRSQEARREACEAEVRLNARLCPEVYLGVVSVVRNAAGSHRLLRPDDAIRSDERVVDHAVHMRRLAAADRLDQRLARGTLADEHLRRLAERLASFHEACATDSSIARFGLPEAIALNVRENFDQTRESVRDHLSDAEAAEIERWQLAFLERRAPLFHARASADRVRDGHGDLRLEQIYATDEGEPSILDCIEFNERFRYGDVYADIAFFSMDLALSGRVDLAERFLAHYARASQDYDGYALVDFYESYRAFVRGKVSSMLAADEGASPALRDAARKKARRSYLLALAMERRSLIPPSVIAVGGVLGSGKTTLSDALSAIVGGPAIQTDRTRKHLLGVMATERIHEAPWEGAYDASFTARVYDEVFRRASVVLRSGRPVVLDASFRERALRQRAQTLALEHGVPFHFVECVCPLELCRERLVERAKTRSVSDGRIEIFDEFVASWEPADGLEAMVYHRADTSRPVVDVLADLRQALPAWPEGLNA